MGIPGKGTWQSEWAELLNGLEVYLWIEPDEDNYTQLAEKVAESVPKVKITPAPAPAPAPIKDINQALVLGHDVGQLVERAKASSKSIKEFLRNIDQALQNKVAPVLESEDPIELVKQAMIDGGYGGDVSLPLIIYLSLTSRLKKIHRGEMLVHMILLGESSSGKTFALNTAQNLFPSSAVTQIPAGTPRVLIYGNYETEHAGIIFGEADSLPAGEDSAPASAIRTLLQENVLEYHHVVKDKDSGDFVVKKIKKPGPTVLITTAVKPLGHQLMTRLFSLDFPTEDDQINSALDQITSNHLHGVSSDNIDLVAFQDLLQTLAPFDVYIPFLREIRDRLPSPESIRHPVTDLTTGEETDPEIEEEIEAFWNEKDIP